MIIMAMREKIQGRAGKVFMIFIFMTFFGGLGISKLVMNLISDSDAVVRVNKILVPHDVFRLRVAHEEKIVAGFKAKYGQHTDVVMRIMGFPNDPYATALRVVTHQAILDSLTKSLGIELAPEYMSLKTNDPYFLMNVLRQEFPTETIDNPIAIYQMIQQSPNRQEFDAQLKHEMYNDFTLSMVRSGLYIPSFVRAHGDKEMQASKKFGVQKFALPFFVEQARKAGATPEALKSFFDQQNAQSKKYWVQEKRAAIQWTFTPKAYGITVSESEIADFYAKQKATRFIDAKAQVKVRELVLKVDQKEGRDLVMQEARRLQEQAVQNPTGFVALIKKHSTAKESRDKDGVVDFFAKSANPSEFEKAAFRLKADGDISSVIELDGKLVILQRVARKEATYKPLTKVKDEIVRLLTEQKFKVAFAKDVSPVIHTTDAAELDRFVQQHGGVQAELPAQVKPEEPSVIQQKLFGIRKEGNMAAFIDDHKGILLKVTSIARPQAASFKAVKDQVAQDYYEQEGLKLLKAAMAEAKKAALAAKKLVPAAGATISSTEWINNNDSDKVNSMITAQEYPADFMLIDKVGGSIMATTKSGGVIIVLEGLQELKNPTAEQKNKVATQVYKDYNRLYTQGFIASLYRDATIKVNEELARTVERQQ